MLAGVARYLLGPSDARPAGRHHRHGGAVPHRRAGLAPGADRRDRWRADPGEGARRKRGGSRRVIMDAVGLAVGEVLPAAYRGAYGRDDDTSLDAARAALSAARRRL